ncbi:MAG: two-component regulator propeller domain-containing protein [Gammaproteobacteria bacterium]
MRASARSMLVFLLLSSGLLAAEPATDFRPITDFHVTRWTTEDGAPADIIAMTQTSDGWLWLGGNQGLYRFDGVVFEPVLPVGRGPKQPTAVFSLFAEENGDLWVGYLYGGITQISNGSMRHFSEADGLPVATVISLARDADGVLWAGTTAGLLRFDGKRWYRVGAESGFTDRMCQGLELDGSGALWAIGFERLFRRAAHETRFERTAHVVEDTAGYFLKSRDGSLWYEDAEGLRRLPDQVVGAPSSKYANSQRLHSSVFDREGHLWSAPKRGIARIRVPAGATEIRFADAASSRLHEGEDRIDEYLISLLEDLEGNIWLSTRGGLQRFRHTNIRRLTVTREDNGGNYALVAGGGALWIGTDDSGFQPELDGLYRYDGRFTRVLPKVVKGVTAADRAPDGRLWFAGPAGVWRREVNGDFTTLPAPPTAMPRVSRSRHGSRWRRPPVGVGRTRRPARVQ